MMTCGLSKSLGFSSSLKKQQGIVTILGTGDSNIPSNTSSAPSLRRTFSADLSSKNWVSQNGFSPMKRISSSEKLRTFAADSSTSGDEEQEEESRSGFDIWAQIQDDKSKKSEEIELGQSDVWSSILSDKKKVSESSNDTVPPPYVHPLMKRASSLSEKSLEICTESLGSETGCEGFSWHASSETGDAEIEVLNVTVTKEDEETETEVVEIEQEPITVPNHTPCIELPRGSFPPPIRSLSSQSGSALHMKTRRDNGRLVLEAVSMPSHNNFSAKRQDGHLLLAFAEISDEFDIASDEEDETAELQWFEEEEEEEEEVQDEFAYKPNGLQYKLPQNQSGLVTVHRLAHKPMGVPKRNSRWPAADEFETKSDVVHSLPPRPRVAQLARSMKPPSTVDDTVGAACFNTCDYSWKPTNTENLDRNTKHQFQAQNYVHKSIGVGHDGWINVMGDLKVDDDAILKSFLAEVGEVERDNEVVRILSCFKLNPFEHLNLSFDSSTDDVKRQYRKISLMVHPDKCKHPQAQEAFGALAKAQQLLLNDQERDYILTQVHAAKQELKMKRKKQLKKDTASKIKSLVDEGKHEQLYEQSEDFQKELKLKVREILTDQEWRRRKMAMRISEEEGRLKKDEEEQKEIRKKKREHEEQWEGTRENRVSSWRDFMKAGKKAKKGETRPPKLKTEDPNKSYVQRPVKKG
ncbi:hypothetical protein IGI04_041064 [Brassica rapa subsp. trilocularis]|uniref:J domain-containing protein n=1 Tax=Brassica rapa subsp. trilocularis TaxID=1813537 RepID=A0ABQ7KTR8_BRACM|nr:hypothetical protein IGI04_041064 [Brassica rapa subsp. trilocularis]